MPLTEPWDKLLPEMRLRVRAIVLAIKRDEPPITPPDASRAWPVCSLCGKRVMPRGLHSHMRSHRNHDSWISP